MHSLSKSKFLFLCNMHSCSSLMFHEVHHKTKHNPLSAMIVMDDISPGILRSPLSTSTYNCIRQRYGVFKKRYYLHWSQYLNPLVQFVPKIPIKDCFIFVSQLLDSLFRLITFQPQSIMGAGPIITPATVQHGCCHSNHGGN